MFAAEAADVGSLKFHNFFCEWLRFLWVYRLSRLDTVQFIGHVRFLCEV